MTTSETLLYGRSSHKISLSDALTACAGILTEAVALIYSPQSCQLARVEPDGSLSDCAGKNIKLQPVFEARVFNTTYELRWLNQQNGLGRAVLISEQEISGYLTNKIQALRVLKPISQQYLIWGKGIEKSTSFGWGLLTDARIGSLYVPISGITKCKKVYLKTCEYLQVGDEYGNVVVIEERLMNLEVK